MEQLISLLRLDAPDHNGIVFPTFAVEEACKEFEDRIKLHGGILGECGIPADVDLEMDPSERYARIDLSRVSHIVRHVWINNSVLECKVQLLGKYAEIAKHMGIEFYGVPRSTGAVEEGSKLCTKYTLITVDLALPEITDAH